MKTIDIAFTTDDYNAPDHLINVATIEDVETIYKVGKALKDLSREVFSVNVDVVLFDIPEDSDFRYDVTYVICYIGLNGEVTAYQYFQSKYDASIQIESDAINLDELVEFLNKEVCI